MKIAERIKKTRIKAISELSIDGKTIDGIIEYFNQLRKSVPQDAKLDISDCEYGGVDMMFVWSSLETDEEYSERQRKEKIEYSEENYQRELKRLNEKYGRK